MTRRIAILNTNTDGSDLARRFPDDGERTAAALRPHRPDWSYEVWRVKDGEFPADPAGYDGWLLTGSVASVNDEAPWMSRLEALLRDLDARRVPMVGLCFGHQIIAKALGGRVGPSPGGWRIGVATTHYSVHERWMQPARASVALYAAHREQVLEPPPVARVIGGDAFTPVGALAVGEHVFTTQYHPELARAFMQALLDEFGPAWPPELVARARVEIEAPVDAELFMRWVAQFLERA